jgi:hypothetical protein
MEDPIHSGTLEDGHRTRTSLGKSPQLTWRLPSNPQCLRHTPQLNWRLPIITTKAPQSMGKSLQLNWRSPNSITKPLSRLRFQEPKSNKLLIFTAMNLQRELKPMQPMQWQEHTKCSNPSLPKSTKETNAIWEIWEEEQLRKSTNESKI